MSGLPFSIDGGSDPYSDYYVYLSPRSQLTLSAAASGYAYLPALYAATGTAMDFYQASTGGSNPSNLSNTSFANSTEVNFNFWYYTTA